MVGCWNAQYRRSRRPTSVPVPADGAGAALAVSDRSPCGWPGAGAVAGDAFRPLSECPLAFCLRRRPTMSFAILGLGTALPPYAFTQENAARVAQVLCLDPRQASLVPVLYRQTEILKRHIRVLDEHVVRDIVSGTRVSGSPFLPSGQPGDHGPTTHQRMQIYVKEAPALALAAAQRALAESGLSADAITHLVTVSCTGFRAPGVDIALIKELGLSPTVERTHVGFMGCHGALNGLRVARALAAAEPGSAVLLCAVELCSLHYHYGWDPKRVVANALFADGAAAVVGVAEERRDCWSVAANGARLFPDCEYAMTWDVGDHGFDMTLSTKVPNLIEANLRGWLETWLARHGLALADVASWAVHPGGPRVLSAVDGVAGPAARGDSGFSGGAGAARQHVVADGAFHPRPLAPPAGAAAVRGDGIRSRPGGGGGAVRVTARRGGTYDGPARCSLVGLPRWPRRFPGRFPRPVRGGLRPLPAAGAAALRSLDRGLAQRCRNAHLRSRAGSPLRFARARSDRREAVHGRRDRLLPRRRVRQRLPRPLARVRRRLARRSHPQGPIAGPSRNSSTTTRPGAVSPCSASASCSTSPRCRT